MLGLGLASSNALCMFRPAAQWPELHATAVGDVPQPHEAAEEDGEVLQGYRERVDQAFDRLRQQIEAYEPEALVVIGSDPGAIFGPVHMPQFWLFTGEELSGPTKLASLGEDVSDGVVTLACHSELANYLVEGLVDRKLDVNWGKTLRSTTTGSAADLGPRAFTHPMPKLVPKLDIPIVPIFVNSYFPPAPNGHRCHALGEAITDVLRGRNERVAIYASGGLSGDPSGPRAGWIDTRLDLWALERLRRGNARALESMFDVESDTLRGSTGEYRSWIAAAAASEAAGHQATIVDYIPTPHAVVGLGFAYWSLGSNSVGNGR